LDDHLFTSQKCKIIIINIQYCNNILKNFKEEKPLDPHPTFFDLSSDFRVQMHGRKIRSGLLYSNPSLPFFQRGSKDRHDKKRKALKA